jgi:hypothetical protein
MTRKKNPTDDNDSIVSATFRVPSSLLVRLDAFVADLMLRTPGLKPTRSDAARVILLKALDEHEKSTAAR